ncbi:MAG: sulfite exporter TauE/SafE family protein [Chitinophagaceae bacterium]|nr:sulfite exporter TauE/SafE family protein [Chitinophagaceae bacterium]MCW5928812.1 sulfite exporter TauE/SafE family protein [Chitinophagaceae bacterium]
MDVLAAFPLSNWLVLGVSAFVLGLAKAGLKGIDILNVTLMAIILGSKTSTGVVLPLLCVGDIMAVWYYNRHVQWKHFWLLAPWIVAGILVALWLGKDMNEEVFRRLMAVLIITVVLLMVYMEVKKSVSVPKSRFFVAFMGLISGVATMIGNLAGPFANIYFLAMRMPKNEFIGTAAWLFLIINIFKFPLQLLVWNNINTTTLSIDLVLLPFLACGFWLGIKMVGYIKDEGYRRVVIALTLAGALFIFMK